MRWGTFSSFFILLYGNGKVMLNADVEWGFVCFFLGFLVGEYVSVCLMDCEGEFQDKPVTLSILLY